MQVFNLNIYTIIIFLLITGFLLFLFFRNKSIFSLKYLFLFLSFLSIFLSIFWIKYFSEDQMEKSWIDVVFVLDVSKSMNVADIKWNNWNYMRLQFAKKAISDFVLNHQNNRYWLIIFAWDAKSSLPLTTDLNLFLTFLKNADYKNFENQWSSFSEAIKLAENRLLASDDKQKAVILFSDGGEDEDKISPKIKDLISKNSKYFIIWVGSENWWKIILGQDVFWNFTFQKYNWADLIAKLNEKNLQKLAEITSWKYLKMEKIQDLEKIENDLNSLEKNIFMQNSAEFAKSFSRILAFISFLFFTLFLVFYILDEKKYVK